MKKQLSSLILLAAIALQTPLAQAEVAKTDPVSSTSSVSIGNKIDLNLATLAELQTLPGAGGEVQLTDAIDALMNLEQVDAYYMKGKSHDCGSKLGYMKANVEYALRHPSLGEEFKEFLATIK